MKLATWKDGSRDGQLVVVSRDLTSAHFATGMASTLQQLLDDWNFVSPQLEDLYATLNGGKARHAFAFDARQCMAPLPRAFQWLDGMAYPSHLQRLHGSPAADLSAPGFTQGGSDRFLGPHDDAVFADACGDIDCGARLAVVTGDVASGTGPDMALDSVRLLMLANAWTLRKLQAAEQARGSGLVQALPATAFGAVAVTTDELGPAWQGGRVHLRLRSACNGQARGQVDAATGMHWHFGQLIAHCAHTRPLRAGSVISGGTVSHPDREQGCACVAELRAQESVDSGAPQTPWLQPGDRVHIEMHGSDGHSLFGAIEQRVALAADPA